MIHWCGEQYPRWHADIDGNVYRDGKKVKPTTSGRYFRVWDQSHGRNGKGLHVHVLVCTAFHGPRPPGLEVAHYNDIKTDNRPGNLRWATVSENRNDAVRNGTHVDNNGERNGRAKLTTEDVRAIRQTYADGITTQIALAETYGVSVPTVSMIVHRKRWAHVN